MSGEDHRADIGPRKGLVGGDHIMTSTTNPPLRGHQGPSDIRRISVDEISMGVRKREPTTEVVAALKADIEQIGLLQPIGVRHDPDKKGHFILIWGANRLAAYIDGWGEAQKLLAERGVQDEHAFRQAKMWQQIPAIVFHMDIPAADVERREIAENLIRAELTVEEKAIQRIRYSALVQKMGRAAEAGVVRNANKEATLTRQPHHVADGNKPETATSITARELGVNRETLRRDAGKVEAMANVAARASGQTPVKNLTPESSPEEKDRAARLAEKTARLIRAERAAGRRSNHIAPLQPADYNVIIARIDITDPTKIATWFAGRLTATDKPLTTRFLRDLAKQLIAAADAYDKETPT
jgi:hypothetical protein